MREQHGRAKRAVSLLAVGAVAALSLAGCGATTGNEVTISAYEMGYKVSGAVRPGVAKITFRNTGHLTHMMATLRLKPGVSLDQVRQTLSTSGPDAVGQLTEDDPATAAYATPALLSPGESATTVSPTLKAGTYLVACYVPDDKGMPHVADGMLSTFTVKGSSYGKEPQSKGTISLTDHGITLPGGFAGSGTFLVENTGSTEHTFSVARLQPGTTLLSYFQHVNDAFQANKPIDGGGGTLLGGVDTLQPGQRAYVVVGLTKGHYGYVSTGGGDGRPTDVSQGLKGEFDVR